MVMPSSPNHPSDKPIFSLAKYAGIGTQLITGLLITLYLGKKADAYFNWHNRAAWILPSFFILSILFMVVRDTQKKK